MDPLNYGKEYPQFIQPMHFFFFEHLIHARLGWIPGSKIKQTQFLLPQCRGHRY